MGGFDGSLCAVGVGLGLPIFVGGMITAVSDGVGVGVVVSVDVGVGVLVGVDVSVGVVVGVGVPVGVVVTDGVGLGVTTSGILQLLAKNAFPAVSQFLLGQ